MTVPSFKDLMNPTLEAIREAGGSASIGEITKLVIKSLSLPDDTVNQLHKNGPQTELEYRLGWARTYLKQYGLITNSVRGVWTVTPQSKDVLTVNPDDVVPKVQQAQGQGDDAEGLNESEDWIEPLIAALQDMPSAAFERLCQLLLRESGFTEVEVTGKSGDGGIDGHGIMRLGELISLPVFFQCKRYRGSVTPSLVRDFRGAMAGRSDKGLLITTGRFTNDAKQEATRAGATRIDLIDGYLLAQKLKELGLGVKTEKVEQVTVYPDWFSTI